jgi:hypothetical protein
MKEKRDWALMSEGAKKLQSLLKEVQMISAQASMNLINTRQRLQPFTSEGFVYKDRKKRHGDMMTLETFVIGSRQLDERVNQKVSEYRQDIRRFMKDRDFEQLERVFTEITEYSKHNVEATKIAKKMQLDII